MRTVIMIVLAAAVLTLSPAARAEEAPAAPPAPPAAAPPASQDDVRALAEELRRLKLEIGLRDVEYQSYGGLGPAASKVYFAPKGLSIGGYGEAVYANQLDGRGDQSDLLRLVLYVGYRFTDRLVFNAEVEFEHGGVETAVEFAYLDYRFTDAVQLRVGSLLVPVGMVNELHEPPFFHGVFRPDLERNLVPATWNENGLGLHGEVGPIRYQAYLLTGLDATGGELREGSWLRNARTGGSESPAETVAGVLALSGAVGPATLGGSVYRGRAGQGEAGVDADVTLAEVHGRLAWRGLGVKAIYAVGALSDAGALPVRDGEVLGSRVRGGYLELAYDVAPLLWPGGETALEPFVRYQAYDLNDEVPQGQVRSPAADVATWTAGLSFKPIPTVVLKADWQRRATAAAGSEASQVNVGAGFVF
jgi:hypothetical protein